MHTRKGGDLVFDFSRKRTLNRHGKHELLVILVGLNRGFNDSWLSFKEKVIKPLEDSKKFKIETFAFISMGGNISNLRSGEEGPLCTTIPSDLVNHVTIFENSELLKSARAYLRRYPPVSDVWEDGHVSTTNLIASLFLQQYASKLVAKSSADLVLVTRPDLVFHSRLSWFEIVRLEHQNALFPCWGSFGGLNDRFAIMSKETALIYLDRLRYLEEYRQSFDEIHSERFLGWLFRNVRVSKSLAIRFSRLRIGGLIEKKDLLMRFPHAFRIMATSFNKILRKFRRWLGNALPSQKEYDA